MGLKIYHICRIALASQLKHSTPHFLGFTKACILNLLPFNDAEVLSVGFDFLSYSYLAYCAIHCHLKSYFRLHVCPSICPFITLHLFITLGVQRCHQRSATARRSMTLKEFYQTCVCKLVQNTMGPMNVRFKLLTDSNNPIHQIRTSVYCTLQGIIKRNICLK